jgi:RNA polymerase sigma-70 factor (ECF subfamily)
VPAHPLDRAAEFNRFRGLLLSIAYRMLGSVADAEDILQEAFLRWHRASADEIHSTRAFLVTIVSRLCINQLQSARLQREEYVGQWLPEPVVTDPRLDPFMISDIDESLSMAFLVLLERLTPAERAVFLLHEVFDYDHSEVAQAIGKDEANCRQILRRALQHMAQVRPRFQTSPQQQELLLANFLKAAATGDLQNLVALLSADVVFHSDGGGKAPAIPNLVHGPHNVARAILGGLRKFVPANVTRRIAHINGEPGLVSYLEGRPFAVFTIHVVEGRIQSIFVVTNPEKLAHLPALPLAPS